MRDEGSSRARFTQKDAGGSGLGGAPCDPGCAFPRHSPLVPPLPPAPCHLPSPAPQPSPAPGLAPTGTPPLADDPPDQPRCLQPDPKRRPRRATLMGTRVVPVQEGAHGPHLRAEGYREACGSQGRGRAAALIPMEMPRHSWTVPGGPMRDPRSTAVTAVRCPQRKGLETLQVRLLSSPSSSPFVPVTQSADVCPDLTPEIQLHWRGGSGTLRGLGQPELQLLSWGPAPSTSPSSSAAWTRTTDVPTSFTGPGETGLEGSELGPRRVINQQHDPAGEADVQALSPSGPRPALVSRRGQTPPIPAAGRGHFCLVATLKASSKESSKINSI